MARSPPCCSKANWATVLLLLALSIDVNVARGYEIKVTISKSKRRNCSPTGTAITEYIAMGPNSIAKLSSNATKPIQFRLQTDQPRPDMEGNINATLSTWDGSKRLYLAVKGKCNASEVVFSATPFPWIVSNRFNTIQAQVILLYRNQTCCSCQIFVGGNFFNPALPIDCAAAQVSPAVLNLKQICIREPCKLLQHRS